MRRCLAGREFERDSSARIFAGHAQSAIHSQVIDLDHHAIHFIVERVAPSHPLLAVVNDRFYVLQVSDRIGNGKPHRL